MNASLISGLFCGGQSGPSGIAVSGSDLFVACSSTFGGTIGEYTTSGATVNASLISGLVHPIGIAVSGSNLFVANAGAGTIGEYDATTGAPINASLISGLSLPDGIAVSGSNLFVVNHGLGTIGEYTTSGATVNAALISDELAGPAGIAIVPTAPRFLSPARSPSLNSDLRDSASEACS